MKQAFLLLCYCYNIVPIAQNKDSKRDYLWRSGLGVNSVQATLWDFNIRPTAIDGSLKKHGNAGQVGMICNTNGNLLLFSNGCYFVDKKDSIIPNSNRMNAGVLHDMYCPPNTDGYLSAPMTILPDPSDTNTFISFHTRVHPRNFNEADALLMTKLVKDANERFHVAYIDSVLIVDTLERGHLGVCRHGNGRDWWILHPKKQSNQYHKILFSPDRFQKKIQSIGISSTTSEDGEGQALFSPDGNKYVRYNLQSDIRIFNFDRCSGLLSNPIHIPIVDASDTIGFAGCAISANSRFLYIISSNKVYQYDLQASNIANYRITVLTYDGYEDPANFRILFSAGLLGADGKIYITANFRWYLHVIEAPDSAGLACRAVQRKYHLVNSIYDQLPVFPNFRLGRLQGSLCDTLTNQEVVSLGGYQMSLYPNPADGNLNMDVSMPDFDQTDSTIEIYDVLGNRVYHAPLSPFTPIHKVDVSFFANGVYIISLKINGKTKSVQKGTVLH